jgi:uncharacterized protein YcbK (DUF882 family)
MKFGGTVVNRAMLGASLAISLASGWFWPSANMHANATGESRTLSMFNIHTKETITVTYKKDGKYDSEALQRLNVFMRDWRKNESREMDPELIDHIWVLHQQLGSKEPVNLICGYRSASTNESLRRHGGGQAKKSQHILGKAADITFPDVSVKTLRNSALVQEWGGVGYYPTSGVPFVHVDTGGVRMWPRIPRLELAALFPDGSSKYLPADGKPITPNDYKLALAKGLVKSSTMVAVAEPSPQPQSAPEAKLPLPILASYAPEPAASAAAVPTPSPKPKSEKRFLYASIAGGSESEPPRPSVGLSPSPPGQFPLYQDAEVVGAPEADEDHPEELSYVPFEVASLMTDRSITYNRSLGALTAPEQRDLSYLFEDMDRPLALNLRPTSGYQGLAAAQSFSGQAVKSFYAELEAPRSTQLAANTDR